VSLRRRFCEVLARRVASTPKLSSHEVPGDVAPQDFSSILLKAKVYAPVNACVCDVVSDLTQSLIFE
jgi:hypothetical protein